MTLLKPLKGLDTALEENLDSCFRQDHPIFEILFCVADPKDPVVPLVKKLLKKYPQVDAQLLMGIFIEERK